MDLRIVNTCNNNCLHCLEGSIRNNDNFISIALLLEKIINNTKRDNITFYGGNSLLHPELLEIINFCNKEGYKGIGLLSNTFKLNSILLKELKGKGLKTFGFYFNSFNKNNHEIINGGGISYELLLKNMGLLYSSGLYLKCSIYINKLNIETLARDIYILNKKYGIKKIDFIGFFPFDKPYENRDILFFDFEDKRRYINLLFNTIKKLNLNVKFVKLSKDFFGNFSEFYDFNNGILNQIGDEDNERLSGNKIPFCFIEKRCKLCFLKDYCDFIFK